MRCELLATDLAAMADGSVTLEGRRQRHVGECLRCQADLVQHRRILRALRSMRAEVLEPAPGLLADVLATLEAAQHHRAARPAFAGRKVAYLGGLAAATAAGAAGVLVVANRHRRAS